MEVTGDDLVKSLLPDFELLSAFAMKVGMLSFWSVSTEWSRFCVASTRGNSLR